MRILFAGSPAIAVPSLRVLSELEMERRGVVLAGLLTNPDRARKRGREEATDVSKAACEFDTIRKEMGFPPITQIKFEKLDEEARRQTALLAPDLLVSFAYGRLFGPRFLALFPLGGINIHPSLLPKYRGASPIPAAILAQEKETGICIQKLAAEMDTGDILASVSIELSGGETTASLSETVSREAALLLRELLFSFKSVSLNASPQKGEATYCREIKKEEGFIDWSKSAVQIDAQIRAFTPWPLSFTRHGDRMLLILEVRPLKALPLESPPGKEINREAVPGTVLGIGENGILIQTGEGLLVVSKLQWQTKKALDWKSFCNGERDFIGSRMG